MCDKVKTPPKSGRPNKEKSMLFDVLIEKFEHERYAMNTFTDKKR